MTFGDIQWTGGDPQTSFLGELKKEELARLTRSLVRSFVSSALRFALRFVLLVRLFRPRIASLFASFFLFACSLRSVLFW